MNIKSLGADYELVDGERLQLAVKDLGSSDLYPQVWRSSPSYKSMSVPPPVYPRPISIFIPHRLWSTTPTAAL